MSKSLTPSPMVECFVRNVREEFPKGESTKLDQFSAAIERTTSVEDSERARRCFEWAYHMADDKSQSHPRWREIKELHHQWKDTWFGLEFGLMAGQGAAHTPGEDIHIQWVEDAVAVAKTRGEEDGWDQSPWESLLCELIDIGGDNKR